MTQAIWTRHLLDIHVLHGVPLRDFSKRCSPLKDVVIVVNLSPILLQQPEHLNLQISNLREKKNPFLKLEPNTPLQVLGNTILLFSWLWHITHSHLQALNFHNMSLFQIFYFLSFCFLSLDEIKFSEKNNNNNSSDCIKHSRNQETCERGYWNQYTVG